MDQSITLVPLVCPQCATPIPAEPDEVAWVCSQCGKGLALDESQGLQPLQVHFAAGLPADAPGKPYWVVEGQVSLQRETYHGASSREAQEFWSQPRRFFIPAFTCSLEELLAQSIRWLAQPPKLEEGPAGSFAPATLASEDVRPLAEFVVMAVEAGRRDKLKSAQISLQLSTPELWVFP